MPTQLADLDALEDLLEGLVSIPTVPSTLTEINKILDDPDGSAKEAAEVVARDPAVATKVLRLVNSAYYALKNPVSSIPFAVSILGLKVLKNLVVQATILDTFGGMNSPAGLDSAWLWEHSFKAGVAASHLARHASDTVKMIPEDAYTCGLIHDVGRIIMGGSLGAKYARTLLLARKAQKPLLLAEQEAFQFTHAAVGALLSERWRLSPRLSKAILHHHEPETLENDQVPEDRLLGHLLHAADTLAHAADENQAPYLVPGEVGPCLDKLAIPEEAREELLAVVKATRREL